MLMKDLNIIVQDFNGNISVDGFNIYDQNSMQFSLYKLVNSIQYSSEAMASLGLDEDGVNLDDYYLIFPFQCGIKFLDGYHILNTRDCLGVTTQEKMIELWRNTNGIN